MAILRDHGAQAVVTGDIGLRLVLQDQRLWRIEWWTVDGLSVDQTEQEVHYMGLGRHAGFKGHLDRGKDRLLVVMQDQGQDVDHLAITAGLAQHVVLQLSECLRQFREGCAIPQSAGLALNDCQIVMPVVDCTWWLTVRALDDPIMLAEDLPLGDDHQSFRINPQADRAIGEGCEGPWPQWGRVSPKHGTL